MKVVRAALACLVLAAGGCGPRSNHERIGDRRYAEGAWLDALAEYRLAARQGRASAELRGKLGAAALRAGALEEAAAAWRDLAGQDAAARVEATEGLMRTARLAAAAHDVRAMRAAVDALRAVAPQRLGELGGLLLSGLDPERRAASDDELVLAAAAHAGRTVADSLLVTWAELSVRGGRCDEAARGFEAVLRRGGGALARAARGGLAGCRVEEGRELLAQGRLDEAEELFRVAIVLATPDSTVRLAWVLLGDARWAAGDSTGATTAYGKAIQGGDPSSAVVQRAEAQLERLLGTSTEP